MKNFAMYLKHFGYRVHVVGDVTCPAIKPGDVFFAVSGTGETSTTLNMVKKCKEIGEIKVLLMTAAEKSSIGDLADLVLRVDCPLPGVPSTVSSIQPIGGLFDECVVYALDWALRACLQERLGRRDGAGPMHSNLE